MSFSSGTYSLYATGNPVVTNTTISSTWANNTLNDIATALSTCLLKDGTQTATASVPFAFGIDVTTAATTPSTTFAVFNTTATTINAFGAASVALNIGHASAAAAFAGGISIPTGKNVTGAGTAQVTGFATVSATTLTGTLSTAAQANITSLGTLTGLSIGPGGTGASSALITLEGSSGSDQGAYINFKRNNVSKGYLGTASVVLGGTSDDLVLANGINGAIIRATQAGVVTVANLAGVGNRYAYVDTNGALTAGAAYP